MLVRSDDGMLYTDGKRYQKFYVPFKPPELCQISLISWLLASGCIQNRLQIVCVVIHFERLWKATNKKTGPLLNRSNGPVCYQICSTREQLVVRCSWIWIHWGATIVSQSCDTDTQGSQANQATQSSAATAVATTATATTTTESTVVSARATSSSSSTATTN